VEGWFVRKDVEGGSGEGVLGVCVRAGEGSVHASGRIGSW
jgi:hypothetical protein